MIGKVRAGRGAVNGNGLEKTRKLAEVLGGFFVPVAAFCPAPSRSVTPLLASSRDIAEIEEAQVMAEAGRERIGACGGQDGVEGAFRPGADEAVFALKLSAPSRQLTLPGNKKPANGGAGNKSKNSLK